MNTTAERKLTADELRENLSRHTGTENYHRATLDPNFLITDGVRYLCENAGAFWLIDAIASHQRRAKRDPRLREMQFWTLKVNPDRSCELFVERDTDDRAFGQKIPYTDFPLDEIKVWVAPLDEKRMVALLPSEY